MTGKEKKDGGGLKRTLRHQEEGGRLHAVACGEIITIVGDQWNMEKGSPQVGRPNLDLMVKVLPVRERTLGHTALQR